MTNPKFWLALDTLLAKHEIIIDRPKGTAHPKQKNFTYPLDYGYLDGTNSGDGEGIDVFVGSGERQIDAIIVSVDTYKKDSEIKILVGCNEEEKRAALRIYTETYDTLQGILVRRGNPWNIS
ncbi:MAG: inorganic pyrophosphatase [Oscillospiraceae bacterium]|nr:inorganic pyrophosphatase [Oscillospiraceae bacterium]